MQQFFNGLPLLWNILIFAAAGSLVWGAGVKLSKFADEIIDRTGVSAVFMGAVGLAVITSLPEVATTVSATLVGDVDLAVNNLFGSIALQITILAIADALIKEFALSGLLENPVSRLQAVGLIFLLSLATIAILFQDKTFFRVGVWSIVLFSFYVGLSYLVTYFKRMKWWVTEPSERESIGQVKAIVSERLSEQEQEKKEKEELSAIQQKEPMSEVMLSKLGFSTLLAALLVLVGGYLVAQNADTIAQKTGMASSFMGFFFVGLTTSLPELSTTLSAIRLKRYRMAFSNIFGTNMLNVGLIFLADLCYAPGPALNQVGNFSAGAALLGILLTSIYLMGLTIKFRKPFLHLGLDSILVLLFYMAGAILLFNMA